MLEEAGEPLTDELRGIYKNPATAAQKRGLGKGSKDMAEDSPAQIWPIEIRCFGKQR